MPVQRRPEDKWVQKQAEERVLCLGVFVNEIKVTVIGTAASRVYFHLKAEAVRMGE